MRSKSAAEKQISGTYRTDRDKKAPQFSATAGAKPPAYLRKSKLAVAEWKAVVPHLESEGILRQTDLSLLASYCLLYARWREAAQAVQDQGLTITVTSTTRTGTTQKPVVNPAVRAELLYQAAMMKAAVKFGLNPLDRPRVEVTSQVPKTDPLQAFINGDFDDDDDDDLFTDNTRTE